MLRCKPTGTGFAFARAGTALLFCALIWARPISAGTTWDGGGGNASWGTGNNWNPNGSPLFNGTETITLGTGFASGTTMTLDGTRYIHALVISTATGFTISAGTGGTLNLRSGNITRQDLGGTEAVQTISAGMILGDPTGVAAYAGTWNISGSNSLNITGNIGEAGGSRGINKTGAGTVILSGTNTFSGGLTISAGTMSISSDANLGASSGGLTLGGGTLQFTDDVIGSRAIVMSGAGIFSGSFGITMEESGAISGNGNLTVTGSGTLILSGSGSNGTGTTTLSSGVLSLRGTVSLGTGNLTFTNGVLELGNGNFTRALGGGAGQANMSSAAGGAGFAAYGADRTVNLGGSGATVTWGAGNFVTNGQTLYLGTQTADHMVDFQNAINLNGASRTITVTGGVGTGLDAKISGVISGAGTSNLVMSSVGIAPWNPGSLLLSNGNNSYAGTTTINAGTLQLSANATGTAGNTVLGSGSSDVLVGNTTGAFDAGLLTNGTVTISRNVRAQSGNAGVITLGGYTATSSTFSGNIFLGTNSGTGKGVTLTAAAGGTTTFSGVIQDPTGVAGPGLLRTNGGRIVLSGVNTYAGGTSIDGGTLSISQSANLGAITGGVSLNAATLQISSGFSTNRAFSLGAATSTFQIDPAQTFTVTTAIGGSGALNKTGSGTMVLSAGNNFTGGTNISSGILQLAAAERLLDSGAVTVQGGTFDLRTFSETVNIVTLTSGSIIGSGSLTGSEFFFESGAVSAVLAGPGNVTKSTSGTVTLSNANTYAGATIINGGILQLTSNNALGTVANGTTVSSGATLNLNNVNYLTAEGLTLNGSGNGNAGALANTGTSTFAGAVSIATDTTINAGGGTLNLTGGIAKSGTTLTFAGGGTVDVSNNGITGGLANSNLVVDGTSLVLRAASSYNGSTTVQNGGTLKLGGNNLLPASPQTALVLNTSTFDLASYSASVASLTGNSSAIVKNSVVGGTSTFTVNPSIGVSTTFAGVIAGTNGGTQGNTALQKNGAGTLILTGQNTFNGATTINGGTLTAAATSGSALGNTNSITVNPGGTFLLGASDQINNAATISLGGGTLAKGNFSEGAANSVGVSTLALTASGSHIDFGTGTPGVLTFDLFVPGANSLTIDNWTGTAGFAGNGTTDRLIFDSDQSANLSNFIFTGFTGGAMELDLGNGYFEITPFSPVPEPSTYLAAALLLAVVGLHERRRIGGFLRRV